MDIRPPQTTIQSSPKIDTLDLKINQQLSVKILSTQTSLQTLALQILQSNKPIQVLSNLPTDSKPGQILQLVVTQLTPVTTFKVVNSEALLSNAADALKAKPLIFKQIPLAAETPIKTAAKLPLQTAPAINIITAKIIDISSDKIQLRIPAQSVPSNIAHSLSSAGSQSQPLNISERPPNIPNSRAIETDNNYAKILTTINKPTVISISKASLNPSQVNPSQVNPSQVNISHKPDITISNDPFKNFKIGQQLTLEVKKTGEGINYKIIETNTAQLTKQQIFSAKVLDVTHNKIQLSLNHLPAKNNNSSQNSETINPIINISKKQLTHSTAELKKGQVINLEVVKTGQRAEFKLLTNQQFQDLKIQQTFKQVLPTQQQPVILLNLLRDKLSDLQKNETISSTLKRLAREIIDNLPETKNMANAKQIKQSMDQSGIFMEANLANLTNKQGLIFQQDFKTQLLRLSHVLKQEIKIKQGQKTQTNELNLLKELHQKTESSIAKIILNQLSSLPKEDVARQIWILDLPFLSQEFVDSVSIEINHEQQAENDEEEQENWSVTITITPPGLGTIHCKVTCFNKTINSLFWSEQQETVTKINQHLDTLKEQFEKAGINPGQLSVHKGAPAKEQHQKVSNQSLIDQRV